MVVGAGLAIAILAVLADEQTSLWGDDLLLWQHSLAVTADNPNVELALADALNRAGKLGEAVKHYQRVTHWYVNPPLLNNYGIALSALGRNEEAAQTFEKLLGLDPHSASGHSNLASVLAQQGKLDEAAEHYLKAIELDPAFERPQFYLGRLRKMQGKTDEALVHLEKAIQLTPDDAAAHAELAATLAERGDTQRAIAEYRLALYINPGDASVHQALEKLQRQTKPPGAPPSGK